MAVSRPDLAEMLVPLCRSLVERERPILEANGISMWGYAVLVALGNEPVRTQVAVAEMIGADKSRIISDLDELQAGGLITRHPDPADRRARLVAITATGRAVRERVRSEIQRQEDELLAQFSWTERDAFVKVARALSGQVRDRER